jgi:hypothetical protein
MLGNLNPETPTSDKQHRPARHPELVYSFTRCHSFYFSGRNGSGSAYNLPSSVRLSGSIRDVQAWMLKQVQHDNADIGSLSFGIQVWKQRGYG